MRKNGWTRAVIGAAILGFIYAPLAVVVLFSFTGDAQGFGWSGATWRWYAALAHDDAAWRACANTLILAAVSAAIAALLGSALGYGLSRFRGRGQAWLNGALYLPVFLPDIALAAAMLLFFALFRPWISAFDLGLNTMILAHVTFEIPFVAIVVRSRMAGLDPALEEAAHDLGANAWQSFWAVVFPLMRPGILAGALLAFTLSLDDFVVSFFTAGPGSTTLPILIYSSVKRGVTPEINALSTLVIALSLAMVMFLGRTGQQEAWRS